MSVRAESESFLDHFDAGCKGAAKGERTEKAAKGERTQKVAKGLPSGLHKMAKNATQDPGAVPGCSNCTRSSREHEDMTTTSPWSPSERALECLFGLRLEDLYRYRRRRHLIPPRCSAIGPPITAGNEDGGSRTPFPPRAHATWGAPN